MEIEFFAADNIVDDSVTAIMNKRRHRAARRRLIVVKTSRSGPRIRTRG